jgi:hypothetical protein
MDEKDSLEQISNFYSGIDEKTLNNISKNNTNIRKLIKLSTITDVKVLDRYNKSWKLKDKEKIIDNCNKIKNKQLKSSGSLLSKLAKLNQDYKIKENVRFIYNELENKLDNINKIINYTKDINNKNEYKTENSKNRKNKTIKLNITDIINCKTENNLDSYNLSDSYIECYSNL